MHCPTKYKIPLARGVLHSVQKRFLRFQVGESYNTKTVPDSSVRRDILNHIMSRAVNRGSPARSHHPPTNQKEPAQTFSLQLHVQNLSSVRFSYIHIIGFPARRAVTGRLVGGGNT